MGKRTPDNLPRRMCVVCRNSFKKEDLIRLVRTEDGVKVDHTGKAPGRGAYVCRNPECADKCARRHILDRVFSGKQDEALYEEIRRLARE